MKDFFEELKKLIEESTTGNPNIGNHKILIKRLNDKPPIDEDDIGVMKPFVIPGNKEMLKYAGKPCAFCKEKKNVLIGLVRTNDNKVVPICHVCYNQWQRCRPDEEGDEVKE